MCACYIDSSWKIPYQMSIFLITYLNLDPVALPVLAHSGFWLWLVSSSGKGQLPDITWSDYLN